MKRVIRAAQFGNLYLVDDFGTKYDISEDLVVQMMDKFVELAMDGDINHWLNTSSAANKAYKYFQRWATSEAAEDLELSQNISLYIPEELEDKYYDIAYASSSKVDWEEGLDDWF